MVCARGCLERRENRPGDTTAVQCRQRFMARRTAEQRCLDACRHLDGWINLVVGWRSQNQRGEGGEGGEGGQRGGWYAGSARHSVWHHIVKRQRRCLLRSNRLCGAGWRPASGVKRLRISYLQAQWGLLVQLDGAHHFRRCDHFRDSSGEPSCQDLGGL